MWLLLLLTTLFAGFSQAMMSFLVMHWSLGPWVGPVFVVVCMTLIIPFISRKWFQDHAIVTIAAGSIGGMIGLCLGMTIPSYYFLKKAEFLLWLADPIWFMGIISLLVLSAGLFAFLIAYMIKDYLIVELQLPFPMSKLIYDIISVEQYSDLHRLMWLGVSLSSLWNMIIFFIRAFIQSAVMQLQMIPLLISAGFIAGHLITVPALIGLANHFFCIDFLHKYFFDQMHTKEFLTIFCLGMFATQILHSFFLLITHYGNKNLYYFFTILNLKHKRTSVLFLFALCMSVFVLHLLGVSIYELCFVFSALVMVSLNVAKIVGEVGIIDINGFVWCVLLPFLYHTNMSSMNLLVIATFVTLCLGIVVDLVFSYKLVALAKISYQRVVRYQALGFAVATIMSGVLMWLYAQSFNEQSLVVFAQDAQDLEMLVNFGAFNYKVFICGSLCGCTVLFSGQALLAVIGMTLMAPSVSVWLIVSGAVSYLVSDRQKLYPLWFGVYAAHALWIVVWSVL